MKYYLLISAFLTATFSFSMDPGRISFPDYSKMWDEVEKMEQEGRLASALEIVDKIGHLANAESNHPQLIKSLLFKLKYKASLEEDSWLNGTLLLQDEISNGVEPSRSVYQSILGQWLQNYRRMHQWEINGRRTLASRSKDIRQWSNADCDAMIWEAYLGSLKDKTSREASIDQYSAVIGSGKKARHLRSTIYQLLFFRLFDHLARDPSVRLNKDQLSLVASPTTSFIGADLSEVSEPHLRQFLELFQYEVSTLLDSRSMESMVDLELHRLRYALDNGANKVSVVNSLEVLANDVKGHEVYAEVISELAKVLLMTGATENPNRVYVKDVLEKAIADHRGSYGAELCRALLQNEILQPELSFNVESVELPNTAFRILVSYRNVASVRIKAAPLLPGMSHELRTTGQLTEEVLKQLVFDEIADHRLPASGDMERHNVEIPLKSLEMGEYLIMIEGYSPTIKKMMRSWSTFAVSDLSYFTISEQGRNDLFVLSRSSGNPISDVSVRLYDQVYLSNERRHVLELRKEFKTDKNGRCALPLPDDGVRYSWVVRLTKKNDDLFSYDDRVHYGSFSFHESRTIQGHVFTDRAIYKPGQTVHVKTIFKQNLDEHSTLVTSGSYELALFDANGQKISSQQVTPNVYGSASTSFEIPQQSMPGRFRVGLVRTARGSAQISVEQYRRPKIEAKFLPIEGQYTYGDSLTIGVKGMTLYGVPLSAAKVSYRISRSVITPYYARGHYYSRCVFPWSSEMEELYAGEFELNDEGQGAMKIELPEAPDAFYDIRPWLGLVVSVVVTDKTGETTEIERVLTITDAPYRIDLSGETTQSFSNLNSLHLKAVNADGQSVIAESIDATIYRVDERYGKLKKRLWATPDQYLLNKESFHQLLPFDPYQDEDNPLTWPREMIWTQTYENAKSVDVDPEEWAVRPGLYLVEVRNGQGASILSDFIAIYDEEAGVMPNGSDAAMIIADSLVVGANKANVVTADPERPFWLKIVGRSGEWVEGGSTQELELTEQDLDDLSYIIYSVRNNRNWEKKGTLDFTKSNDIIIKLEGVEEETIPGGEQSWILTTTDQYGTPVEAEVALTVYDEGLDQYVKHRWNHKALRHKNQHRFLYLNSSQFRVKGSAYHEYERNYHQFERRVYPDFKYVDELMQWGGRRFRHLMEADMGNAPVAMMDEEQEITIRGSEKNDVSYIVDGVSIEGQHQDSITSETRQDLAELALFMADIRTNSEGKAEVTFKMKEDLTRWMILGMAHSIDLRTGGLEKTFITTKDVIIQPFTPQYLYEGDSLIVQAKVVNNSGDSQKFLCQLELKDGLSDTADINGWASGQRTEIELAPGENGLVSWSLGIPATTDISLLKLIFSAKCEDGHDAQSGFVVLKKNSQDVLESRPIFIKPGETITITPGDLNFNAPPDALNSLWRLQTVAAPEWFILETLPFVSSSEEHTTGAIINALYANQMGAYLLDQHPTLKSSIEALKPIGKLEKNEELLIQSLKLTPFQQEAIKETNRLTRIKKFLDPENLDLLSDRLQKLLAQRQIANGGFVWLPSGTEDSWGISQLVLKRNADLFSQTGQTILSRYALDRLISYCDKELEIYFNTATDKGSPEKLIPSQSILEQLLSKIILEKSEESFLTFEKTLLKNAKRYWVELDHFSRAILGQIAFRTGDSVLYDNIMTAFDELLIDGGDRGVFIKHDDLSRPGYLQLHAQLVELFTDWKPARVPSLQQWLLQSKRTEIWEDDLSNLAVIRSFINSKGNLNLKPLSIVVNGETMPSDRLYHQLIQTLELGRSADTEELLIEITNPNAGPAWGGLYHNYTVRRDQVKAFASDACSLKKTLSVAKGSGVKVPVVMTDHYSLGDRAVVRLAINSDRDLDFVMIESDLSAGMHQGIVTSGYEWFGGVSYYRAIYEDKDQFFIRHLRRGVNIIEYELNSEHKGNFNSGSARLQCMYAPEFGALAEGRRAFVE